ncbi:MAG: rRNA-binding ribosome biosynthesis protein utp25 [Thelocarpon impressellum]|nr:MAG: rRNA-binding ribosome biosynthesis protein utp25 [Thelocarpon impressellum]
MISPRLKLSRDSNGSVESPDISEEDMLAVENEAPTDDDEALPNAVPAFSELMKSLAGDRAESGRQRKRRKLEEIVQGPISLNNQKQVPANANGTTHSNQGDDVDNADVEAEGPIEDLDDASDGEEDGDGADAFDAHFEYPDEEQVTKEIQAIEANQWQSRKTQHGKLGKSIIAFPNAEMGSERAGGKQVTDFDGLKLKSKLLDTARRIKPTLDPLEATVAPMIFNYQDLLFSARNLGNAGSIRFLYSLHALNHVFKTRTRVIKNNARLAKDDAGDELDLRDQGFTRPKVLIILPTREGCVRVVDTITALCDSEQQENKKRFQEGYVDTEEKFSADKPDDFRDLFSGNDDDMFRIGLKFTRKTIKFFAQFYSSDIIIASPLGLRMAIGDEGDKKQDHDFLSSIEIVIVDQADALLMQNWEHLEQIFASLNLQPKESHGCDFSRVRNWYLDSNAKFLRQTLVFSAFNTPELNSLFSNHMKNVAGRVKFSPQYDGSTLLQPFSLRQTFSRFDSPSLTADPDARFKYFTTAVLPSLLKSRSSRPSSTGTLIFIPSTLDFIRLRNHLSSSATSISFGAISEYTAPPDVSRARSHFLTGRHALLLYTERAHHFRRYRLRGVRRVLMYGVPDNPVFYREITGGFLERSVTDGKVLAADALVRCLFSRWDGLRLERIVGEERVGTMARGEQGDTFEFV